MRDELRETEAAAFNIGGSKSPIIVGVSNYTTPHELACQMLGIIEPFAGNEATYWGTKHQEMILAEYSRREQCVLVGEVNGLAAVWVNGERIKEDQYGNIKPYPADGHLYAYDIIENGIVHPAYPWMTGHLDAVVIDGNGDILRVVDAKQSSAYSAAQWGEYGEGIVPEVYWVQMQHYLHILRALGHDKCTGADLAVLHGGNRYSQHPVMYDATFCNEELIPQCAAFVEMLGRGELPPVESGADLPALKARFPHDDKSVREITAAEEQEFNLLCQQWRECERAIESAELRRNTVKARIQAMIGDASELRHPQGYGFSWKNNKDSEKFDAKGARAWMEKNAWAELQLLLRTEPGARVFRASLAKMEE